MFDEARAARQADPILGEFFGGTRNMTQPQINWLLGKGIPAPALGRDADGGGMVIGAADVVFDDKLFDWPSSEGELESSPSSTASAALIFVARDAGGDPLDLVAWAPRSARTASRFGRAAVLGEHSLRGLRIGAPANVHRSVLAWLRDGRDGIVIVDPHRAGRALIDMPDRMVAEDEAHAREIAAMMRGCLNLERIVVPVRRAA